MSGKAQTTGKVAGAPKGRRGRGKGAGVNRSVAPTSSGTGSWVRFDVNSLPRSRAASVPVQRVFQQSFAMTGDWVGIQLSKFAGTTSWNSFQVSKVVVWSVGDPTGSTVPSIVLKVRPGSPGTGVNTPDIVYNAGLRSRGNGNFAALGYRVPSNLSGPYNADWMVVSVACNCANAIVEVHVTCV